MLPSLLLVGVLATALWGVITVYKSVVHFGGDRATAHVDRCEQRNSRGGSTTVCYGTWRDGRGTEHHDVIAGAGASSADRDVPIRALGDNAQLDSALPLLPYPIVEFVLLVPTVVLAVVVVNRRHGRSRYAGRGRPPYPPGPPPGAAPGRWLPRRSAPRPGPPHPLPPRSAPPRPGPPRSGPVPPRRRY
jgi:hypothetical protein